jgi:hypothetical protein
LGCWCYYLGEGEERITRAIILGKEREARDMIIRFIRVVRVINLGKEKTIEMIIRVVGVNRVMLGLLWL